MFLQVNQAMQAQHAMWEVKQQRAAQELATSQQQQQARERAWQQQLLEWHMQQQLAREEQLHGQQQQQQQQHMQHQQPPPPRTPVYDALNNAQPVASGLTESNWSTSGATPQPQFSKHESTSQQQQQLQLLQEQNKQQVSSSSAAAAAQAATFSALPTQSQQPQQLNYGSIVTAAAQYGTIQNTGSMTGAPPYQHLNHSATPSAAFVATATPQEYSTGSANVSFAFAPAPSNEHTEEAAPPPLPSSSVWAAKATYRWVMRLMRQLLARAWSRWRSHTLAIAARQHVLQAAAASNLVALPQRQQRASLARAWGRWRAGTSWLTALSSKRAAAAAWARRWSVRNAERLCRLALRKWNAKASKARAVALRKVAQRSGRAAGARGLLAALKRQASQRQRRKFALWLAQAKEIAKAAARREQVRVCLKASGECVLL